MTMWRCETARKRRQGREWGAIELPWEAINLRIILRDQGHMNCRFPPSLHCHLDRPMVASSRNIVSHDIKLCILWSLAVTERNLSQEQDTLRMIIYDPKEKSLVWLVPGIAWFPSSFLLLSREQVPGETLNCPEFLAGKRRHVIHSDQWEEMEVCLKNKLCIFFFMLKMKTWLATLCLCLLLFFLYGVWIQG